MPLLILGLVVWWAAHLAKPLAPGPRAKLGEALGQGPATALFALMLVGSVALMTIGYQRAEVIPVWFPPGWTVHANNLLMLVAVASFAAGGIKCHWRHWVRHPQLTGFKAWAVAHLLVNGDLAAMVLFGGLLAWAVVALIAINKRDGKGPKPGPGTMLGNAIHIGVTLVVFGAITWVHNYLGYWPFPGTPPG